MEVGLAEEEHSKCRDCITGPDNFPLDEEKLLRCPTRTTTKMSDQATIEEVREQLAQTLRTIEALTNLSEGLTQTVADLRAMVAKLRSASRAARDDRRVVEDEPVEGVMHVIGYGPPGTIGLAFETNRLAMAATGWCSHERIKRCRGEIAAADWVAEVAAEMRAGVTTWSRAFNPQNIFAVSYG